MLLSLQNSRIRRLYQALPPPASIASSEAAPASDTRRIFKRSTMTSIRELTADRSYTPFEGLRKRFVSSAQVPEDSRSVVWAASLGALAAAVGGSLVYAGYGLPSAWIVVALAAVAGVAERHGVALLGDRQRGIEIAVSFVPFVFAAVVFGPLTALVVGALGNLADFRRPYLRWAVYTPLRAITGAVAGLAAGAVYSAESPAFLWIIAAVLAAAFAYLAVDVAGCMTTLAIRRSAPPMSYPRATVPLFLLASALYVPVVAFLVYGYEKYSFAVVATFFVPVLALQRVAHLYQEQREAATGIAIAYKRLEQAHLSFAAALVATLDARDQYTAGHSTAVAIYSRDIATRMGLSEEERHRVYVAGLVHDIGKIGLPPGLLEKEGPLSLEERRTMQLHSTIGERILARVDDYGDIAKVVRHHHERVDGAGYPDSVAGEDIPLLARIIAVADAYNAMTSDRPYREAMPSRVARLRLAQAVGSQFDTSVVAAFEAILATADDAYREGTRSDFGVFAEPEASLGQSSVPSLEAASA